jgi:catechol 2,3-dioxygenase-like lactoylglutathione lyase family enzyme
MIVTKDVAKSSQFYQKLLDCKSGHGGDEYEMLMVGDTLVLQLHARDTDEHPELWDAEIPPGNGIGLFFRTDDFDGAVARVRELQAEIVAEPHVNPLAKHHEIWLRDPDGYLVVITDNFGDA